MRFCLYEWLDPKAHDILAIPRNGLTKGYSKILIYESAVPDQRVSRSLAKHESRHGRDGQLFFRKRAHGAELAYAGGTD